MGMGGEPLGHPNLSYQFFPCRQEAITDKILGIETFGSSISLAASMALFDGFLSPRPWLTIRLLGFIPLLKIEQVLRHGQPFPCNLNMFIGTIPRSNILKTNIARIRKLGDSLL